MLLLITSQEEEKRAILASILLHKTRAGKCNEANMSSCRRRQYSCKNYNVSREAPLSGKLRNKNELEPKPSQNEN